ncbi:hypothetical protein GYMLUDRAFT_660632 [Collybiopsis luxurians FD-317 M1]|uniref:U4/U6.U5 small nuclear ribonucleoprotein 27kDa protein domain-containing protein n=1 Tax=Collybiopsis luxurians FD-317 M1 TaxID=944289 RepID=A0A0D0CMG5_9AGAR|nr:hypothetical protein GYMLUDRAFT_660632 [Collybiopsis luxurians FD-317 M1]
MSTERGPAEVGALGSAIAETIATDTETTAENENQEEETTPQRRIEIEKETMDVSMSMKRTETGETAGGNPLGEKQLCPRILDPDYFTNHNDNDPEDAEAGQEFEDDEAAMMATMGMTGFGTTKGKHVEGNQEGTVNIKKTRTWRQYMNRRGGFNRPLDKIK